MKAIFAMIFSLISLPAIASDNFTCSAKGEKVIVTMSRFDQQLTHNGFLFKDCKRDQWNSGKVVFECEDKSNDRGIQLFVELVNDHAVSAGLGYRIRGSQHGGEEDGSTIDLTCKD